MEECSKNNQSILPNYIKKIKELLDLNKPKRKLIEVLIDKIVIDKDKNIIIKFKYDVIPKIEFTYAEENKGEILMAELEKINNNDIIVSHKEVFV